MKTFKDLEIWDGGISFGNIVRRRLEFDNGYGISVISGEGSFTDSDYPYEVAVLKDGKLHYDSPVTDDVIGHCNENDVTELMKKIQEL